MDVLEKAKKEVIKVARNHGKVLFLNNYGLEDKDIESLIEFVFEVIPDLEILDLSHNGLTKLPPIMGEFKDLKSLIVNNNQLKVIEANITHLDNLKFLNFENNQIENVPKNLNNFRELNKLKIKGNPLSVEAKTLLKNTLGDNVFFDVVKDNKKRSQGIENKNNKPRKNSDNWSVEGIRKKVDEKAEFRYALYMAFASKEDMQQLRNHPNPGQFLERYHNQLLKKTNNLSQEGSGRPKSKVTREGITARLEGPPLNERKSSNSIKNSEASKNSERSKKRKTAKKGMFKNWRF